jgi:hypothetical protein
MAVVRRHEHQQRRFRPLQRFGDDEAVDAGHLDVEEHEVDLMRAQRLDRRAAGTALGDDRDVVGVGQEPPQPAPRERFVVDQQDVHRAGEGREMRPERSNVIQGTGTRAD